MASHIMAHTSSNYHALGPSFNSGERIWTHLVPVLGLYSLFSEMSWDKEEMSKELQVPRTVGYTDLVSGIFPYDVFPIECFLHEMVKESCAI